MPLKKGPEMSAKQKSLIVSITLAAMLMALPYGDLRAEDKGSDSNEEFRTCSQSMEITDVRFSARADIGVEVLFDDIGCAVIWRNLQCALDQNTFDAKATVRDFNDLSFVLMSEAVYVMNKNLHTPIGFGIAAFRNMSNAKAFKREKGSGKIMSYKEIIRLDLRPPTPPEEEPEKK